MVEDPRNQRSHAVHSYEEWACSLSTLHTTHYSSGGQYISIKCSLRPSRRRLGEPAAHTAGSLRGQTVYTQQSADHAYGFRTPCVTQQRQTPPTNG